MWRTAAPEDFDAPRGRATPRPDRSPVARWSPDSSSWHFWSVLPARCCATTANPIHRRRLPTRRRFVDDAPATTTPASTSPPTTVLAVAIPGSPQPGQSVDIADPIPPIVVGQPPAWAERTITVPETLASMAPTEVVTLSQAGVVDVTEFPSGRTRSIDVSSLGSKLQLAVGDGTIVVFDSTRLMQIRDGEPVVETEMRDGIIFVQPWTGTDNFIVTIPSTGDRAPSRTGCCGPTAASSRSTTLSSTRPASSHVCSPRSVTRCSPHRVGSTPSTLMARPDESAPARCSPPAPLGDRGVRRGVAVRVFDRRVGDRDGHIRSARPRSTSSGTSTRRRTSHPTVVRSPIGVTPTVRAAAGFSTSRPGPRSPRVASTRSCIRTRGRLTRRGLFRRPLPAVRRPARRVRSPRSRTSTEFALRLVSSATLTSGLGRLLAGAAAYGS